MAAIIAAAPVAALAALGPAATVLMAAAALVALAALQDRMAATVLLQLSGRRHPVARLLALVVARAVVDKAPEVRLVAPGHQRLRTHTVRVGRAVDITAHCRGPALPVPKASSSSPIRRSERFSRLMLEHSRKLA
jgi:hypothetical protein